LAVRGQGRQAARSRQRGGRRGADYGERGRGERAGSVAQGTGGGWADGVGHGFGGHGENFGRGARGWRPGEGEERVTAEIGEVRGLRALGFQLHFIYLGFRSNGSYSSGVHPTAVIHRAT
jgi:hypothetical protein